MTQAQGVLHWQAIVVIQWLHEATLARRAVSDPEAALLGRIYQLLDVRCEAYWHADLPPAPSMDLAALHRAISASRPEGFGNTDLSGPVTTRILLPVALVHPPQGVKQLAYCEERRDFRKFLLCVRWKG